MIKKTTRTVGGTRPIAASTNIASAVRNNKAPVAASRMAGLTAEQRAFTRQLQNNMRRQSSIMAATNTTNIMARPDFLELLPMFVQKLYILDVFGSVAMRSRQQLIPYFKFVAENTKGVTNAGDILSSPFANNQGKDPNFTGRVIKNELVAEGADVAQTATLVYVPVLPDSVSLYLDASGVTTVYTDDGAGNLKSSAGVTVGVINYATGAISFTAAPTADAIHATYQYDNENVGPRADASKGYGHEYGAQMGKGYLQLDEINMVAQAHQLACYWSIYSAFAAQQEYGGNISEIAKEAAFSELTAEINSLGFQTLRNAATHNSQFNWDASPVLTGSVVPSDYLNMFKLKLSQAAASIYQATRLTQPNRIIVGSNVAAYVKMINGFQAELDIDNVGPYKLGQLDQFTVYCDPNFNPDEWVMACKSNDIRRNSALFGEYMPIMSTDPVALANASVQAGYASMFAMEVVNPATVVSGKITGIF